MKIIRTLAELTEIRNGITTQSIGYVPTMGFFHDGHLSLMRKAKENNDVVFVSIFVNPLQFGPNEDFETYPRDEKRDLELAEANGVDYVFIPSVDEMYPKQPSLHITMSKRTNVLCGQSRPGHFDGVATVLIKLFNLIRPKYAYFGLKDAQQFAVINAFVEDLNIPVELIGVPTIREEDGLAKSSRNVFLSIQERNEATALYYALKEGQELVKNGEQRTNVIIEKVKETINNLTDGRIDYVEMLTYPELEKTDTIQKNVILATAVYFEKARLIDNVIFNENGMALHYN